jgi:hypothetical protein
VERAKFVLNIEGENGDKFGMHEKKQKANEKRRTLLTKKCETEKRKRIKYTEIVSIVFERN